MADRFIRDPAEVVKAQQKVTVTVLAVDPGRKRISLSLRSGKRKPDEAQGSPKTNAEVKHRKPGSGRAPQPQSRQPFHNPLAEALARLKT
jgi:uncharacterized protein